MPGAVGRVARRRADAGNVRASACACSHVRPRARARGESHHKLFLYELHVAAAQRKGGVATALLELVERSARGRSAPTVELNVHRTNEGARGFYEHVGFAQTGELSGGSVLVMQRKR